VDPKRYLLLSLFLPPSLPLFVAERKKERKKDPEDGFS